MTSRRSSAQGDQKKSLVWATHLSEARGPVRTADVGAPLGKSVSSEILGGPANGSDAAYLIYTRMPGGAHGPALFTLPADHLYMVLSGKMTIQYVPGSDTEIVATGPNLPFVDKHGIPVESWVMETYQPPYLTRFQGLVRDSGDFGMVANDANEDLVAIVVERARI